MKVLFVMISYPDVSLNTNMYTDLTNEFHERGHEVFVAAPGNESTILKNEGGINVLRIKTLSLFNISVIKKGIATILLPYQYKRAITRYYKQVRFDLIITATPPITFIRTASYLKKRYDAKIYLILRDIFPQNAKDLGLIRNPLIFSYFRRKERKLYKVSDSIGCMSKKNIEYVHTHNPDVNISKLHLLPNWVKVNNLKNNVIKVKSNYDFKDRFVGVFGGNFGVPQKTEFLIEVADKIKEKKDIIFLMIGAGTEKDKIKRLVLKRDLHNIIILDQLPNDEYLRLLEACHVGLVNLSDKFTIPNIPSRTLSYWSLKLPVLAAIDVSTDFGELLESCDGGLWSVTGDVDAYISNLLLLYNNPERRIQMGENGFNYLVKVLNPQNTYNTIISNI